VGFIQLHGVSGMTGSTICTCISSRKKEEGREGGSDPFPGLMTVGGGGGGGERKEACFKRPSLALLPGV